ncbi:MAG: hypothetical protein ACRDL7_00595 [Gaiellaceae bacterium]
MESGALSGRRAAENQSLYRSVNERIKQLNAELEAIAPDGDAYEWLCECADTECTLRISATLAEYEGVRGNPRTFIVAPRHLFPEVEHVLDENSRFMIVEKVDNGGEVAEALDPRSTDPASDAASETP